MPLKLISYSKARFITTCMLSYLNNNLLFNYYSSLRSRAHRSGLKTETVRTFQIWIKIWRLDRHGKIANNLQNRGWSSDNTYSFYVLLHCSRIVFPIQSTKTLFGISTCMLFLQVFLSSRPNFKIQAWCNYKQIS